MDKDVLVKRLMLFFVTSAVFALFLRAVSPAELAGAAMHAAPTCIAIALPSMQGVESHATAVAASTRELFVSILTGPSLKVLSLDARLASQAVQEARQRQCDHVLSIALVRKRSDGSGWLGRAIGEAGASVVSRMPGASVGAAVAGGAAVVATEAVSELAASTKARDEMRIEYELTSSDGSRVLGPKTDKVKAHVDSEDLLTPLVERASNAIAAAVFR